MPRLRHLFGRVALAWLLCQAVTLSLAAATLWPGPPPVRLDCTCIHADGATCPMHEGRRPGDRRCAIGSGAAVPTAALTSVLDMGLLPTSGEPADNLPSTSVDVRRQALRSLRQPPPDPPPPRA